MAGIRRVLLNELRESERVVHVDAHIAKSQVLAHLPIDKFRSGFRFLLLEGVIMQEVSGLRDVIHIMITLSESV